MLCQCDVSLTVPPGVDGAAVAAMSPPLLLVSMGLLLGTTLPVGGPLPPVLEVALQDRLATSRAGCLHWLFMMASAMRLVPAVM